MDVVNDEGRLVTTSSADTSYPHYKEIIRLTGATVIIKAEVMLEEITVV